MSKRLSNNLNHKIDICANTKVTNSLNETSYKFVKCKSIYASIIPQTGNLQKQQADTILTNVTHKIITRYISGKDITKDMQIMFRGHRFEIRFILNPYFKNETLEIFCQELMN